MISFLKLPVHVLVTKKALGIKLAWLGLSIFIINTVANFLYWYSTVWWFDMPMHFLGGYFIGFLILTVILFTPLGKAERKNTLYDYVLFVLGGLLAIGLLWEVFEFIVDMYTTKLGFNLFDTLSDLLFDTAGALTALTYQIFYFSKVEENAEIEYTQRDGRN